MEFIGYHGSNINFESFDKNNPRNTQDYYGGSGSKGGYFTDTESVAHTYASSMAKRGGEKIIYTCRLNIKKIFDVESVFTGPEFLKFLKFYRDTEKFARSAKLLPFGSDKYSVTSSLEKGNIELTGDQVFRGLSDGMINTSKARDILRKLGYDSLKYPGGIMTGGAGKHNVYIVYDPDDITILNKEYPGRK